MAQEVQLEAGTLPPPACYATEQERYEAYTAATTVTISGGIQWEVGPNPPDDLDAYWLQTDANIGPNGIGRPIGAYKYSSLDGVWLPWFREMIFGDDTGIADVYAINPLPAMTEVTAYRAGMMYTFIANQASTGVVTGATFSVGGFPARGLKKNVNENLAPGDIKVDQAVTVISDGVNFQMVSKASETASHGAVPFYSGSGNWTVPVGVFSVVVECVGGGGGGDWGGVGVQGGGGGGYCRKRWTVVPGVDIPYVVGAGGSKTTTIGGGQNQNGFDTSFNTSQIANGGKSGTNGGAGGIFSGADYGFNGTSGARQTNSDKWIGGQSVFVGSQGGWISAGLVTPTDGVLGGGGTTDSDAADPSNQASNGGGGCILITW